MGKSRIVSLGKMALQKFKSMEIGYVLTGEQYVAFSLKFLVHPNQSFGCLPIQSINFDVSALSIDVGAREHTFLAIVSDIFNGEKLSKLLIG